MKSKENNEAITTTEELLRYLEGLAEDYPYLDEDYAILVIEECKKPFIVMNPIHFEELYKKVVGSAPSRP